MMLRRVAHTFVLLAVTITVCATLGMTLGTALAQEPVITSFLSEAELDTQGVLTVTETLNALPPEGAKGIFRDIPFHVRLPNGAELAVPPTVLQVEVDGRPRPVDDVEVLASGRFRIYMRDDAPLMPGEHTFMVRYSMKHVVGFFEEYDELNWNVTGNEWALPIESAEYHIRLPAGAEPDTAVAWLGESGSRDESVNIWLDEGSGTVIFEAARPLAPGEGLTCALNWNKGVVMDTPPTDGAMALPLAVLLAVLSWIYFGLMWWRVGKDPAKGSIIARFYPPHAPTSAGLPEGTPMSSAAVNYLMNVETLESRGVVATLLSLAGRGECSIHNGDKDQDVFYLTADKKTDSPYPEERAAWAKVHEQGRLALDEDGGKTILAMKQDVSSMLAKAYPNVWSLNVLWSTLGLLFVLVGAWTCLMLGMGPMAYWSDDAMFWAVVFCGLGAGLALVPSFVRERIQAGRWLSLISAMIVVAVLLGFLWMLEPQMFVATMSLPVVLALVAAFAALWVFGGLMKAPSVEARRLMDECEGLALYISTAETERFRHLNPPERTPELYTTLLPYAVALNLEKAWGENCARVLDTIKPEEQNNLLMLGRSHRVSRFMRSAEQSVTTYEASKNSATASGSSSRGGGSGSGGGGGGGGFC